MTKSSMRPRSTKYSARRSRWSPGSARGATAHRGRAARRPRSTGTGSPGPTPSGATSARGARTRCCRCQEDDRLLEQPKDDASRSASGKKPCTIGVSLPRVHEARSSSERGRATSLGALLHLGHQGSHRIVVPFFASVPDVLPRPLGVIVLVLAGTEVALDRLGDVLSLAHNDTLQPSHRSDEPLNVQRRPASPDNVTRVQAPVR